MKKIIVAAIMAVMAAFAAEAQEAVVKKFEAVPIDLTAQKYARADLHGVRCAVVKVHCDRNIRRFYRSLNEVL